MTVIVKAARLAEALPSDTEITMFEVLPTLAAAGVPLRRPVDVLKLAHDGLLVIENVRVCPSGSEAVGVNEYACPTVTEVAGVPLMVGAPLLAATEIANAGSDALAAPSVTEITIFEVLPTLAAAGVPLSRPVDVLKLAHDGLLVIENVRAWPSGSDALGVKL